MERRHAELLQKEMMLGLTKVEQEELDDYEREMSEAERVGMTQTQWGWM
jgi:hypothetical protein